MSDIPVGKIAERATAGRDTVVRYLQELIAVPSMSTQEGEVIERIGVQMRQAGVKKIRVDRLGNIVGTLGSGPNVLAFDAHVDTVDVGDLDAWDNKPFEAVAKDGFVYGRGASDQKGGMAAMMLAAEIWRHTGLPEGMTVLLVGSIMEEDSDGLCWQYIVNEERYVPSWVVLTEPTNLAVNHGQRGRVEIEVTTLGRSAHAASPEQGTNAVYLMTPIINAVRKLGSKLRDDGYLGKGTVAVTEIVSRSPSLCAVPDMCRIHLDRRLTAGETDESAVGEIRSLPEVRAANAGVTIPDYSRPSYRGLHYMVKKYYPAWVMDREHVLVKAGLAAAETVLGAPPRLGTWNFSTNGVATMGMFGIPTIGFGPSEEKYAHTPDDRCSMDHLVTAASFYALLPWVLHGMMPAKERDTAADNS